MTLLVLAMLILPVGFAANGDLDLAAKAGQLTPKHPLYVFDGIGDQISLLFDNSVDARMRVAQERFAESVVDEDAGSRQAGEALMAGIEVELNATNSSVYTGELRVNQTVFSDNIVMNFRTSQLVLTRVIRRLSLKSDERNMSIGNGTLVAFARLQLLAGKEFNERPIRAYDGAVSDCLARGLSFTPCSLKEGEVCGPPSCTTFAQERANPIIGAVVDGEGQNFAFLGGEGMENESCPQLVQFLQSSANASKCAVLPKMRQMLLENNDLLERCAQAGMPVPDAYQVAAIAACNDMRCSLGNTSACTAQVATSCSNGASAGQYFCMDNVIKQCRAGVIVDTGRKCNLMSVFNND